MFDRTAYPDPALITMPALPLPGMPEFPLAPPPLPGAALVADGRSVGRLKRAAAITDRDPTGFFDIKGTDVWNGDPQTTFLVFGYPTSLRSVQIDDVSGALAGLTFKMIATSATYDQTSRAAGVHAVKMQRSGDYTSDGLSGGTVYYVGEDARGFYCGFAGLVIRGGETSDILHFIDARAIYSFFKHQEWLLQNKGPAP